MTPPKFFEQASLSRLALLFLLYVACPSFVLSVFLLLRAGSPQAAYWTSLVILSGFALHSRKKLGWGGGLVFFAFFLLCHAFAYYCFDCSFDGLTYHQPAILGIARGFNPVYGGYMNLGRSPDLWSDQATYFPKAAWYFAAALTSAWGDWQVGKVYHLFLILAAAFFIWDALKKESASKRALWLIACLNPIVLTQASTYLVDGAVGTLSTIAVFYAYLFFKGGPISRFQHFFCLVSISMLFCVKTTGFVYGSVVVFYILLHRFAAGYRETAASGFLRRFWGGCGAAFPLGLKIGVPVFSLVLVLGFAPYATNVLGGRHIFYPLVRENSAQKGIINLETIARRVYPRAHNRFTRLLYSVASHSQHSDITPAVLKNPFDVSWAGWKMFSSALNMRAGGLGPMFCLLCLIAIPFSAVFRFRGNAWLLFTLLTLLFIQPYAWQVRYAPFLWLLPLLCLIPTPEKKAAFLWIPFSIAAADALGVAYLGLDANWRASRILERFGSSYAGKTMMLDRTVFEYGGIFDRFGIRLKYVNPEETFFYRSDSALGSLAAKRTPEGVNVFFEEELAPIPEAPLIFADEAALPWLRMSEGLIPVKTEAPDFSTKIAWRTYANKVKFYMALDEEPQNSWELALKGALFGSGNELSVLVLVNNQRIGEWRVDKKTQTAVFRVSKALLEESFQDETRLLTLTLLLPEVPTLVENRKQPSLYGLQLEEMYFQAAERL